MIHFLQFMNTENEKIFKTKIESEINLISNEDCKNTLKNELANNLKIFYKLNSDMATPICYLNRLVIYPFKNLKLED